MNTARLDLIEIMNALGPISDYTETQARDQLWQSLQAAMEVSRLKLTRFPTIQTRLLYVLDVCDGLLLMSRSRGHVAGLKSEHTAVERLDFYWLVTEWIKFARQRIQEESPVNHGAGSEI